jgi:HAD superfamily hydrolase (TIGR01662 family)
VFDQKFKAVFFDWDNTLVYAWPTLLNSLNAALRHFDLPEVTLDEMKVHARSSTREGFPRLFGENWQEAHTIFYQAINEYKDDLKLYDGVSQQLQLLKDVGYNVAIISNKKNSLLNEEIERFGIFSDLVFGAGDFLYDKPHPEMGLAALKHFSLQPQDVVYIGDSITDWIFAKNLNMHAIAIGDDTYDGALLARYTTVNQPIEILLRSNPK